MLSLVDHVLQIAVVIYWNGFLLVLIFMQMFSSAIFSSILWKQLSSKQTHSQGFLSYTVIFSGNSFCTIDVIFLDITNIFQIWSTLAGYQEFALGIWGNQNLRIATIFLKNINKTNSLFSVARVYPGELLQL